MLILFIDLAHATFRDLPTAVDPVKLRCLTSVLEHTSSPTAAVFSVLQGMTFSTPGGPPALSKSFARASAQRGVSGAGLQTTELPAAMAAPALRVIIARGEFHGVIAATTPWGCLIVKTRFSLRAAGMVSPNVRSIAPSNQSRKSVAYCTDTSDSVYGLPSSSVQSAARSSRFALSKSAHRRISHRRSRCCMCRYESKAFRASSIAILTSSRSRFATWHISWSSSGSATAGNRVSGRVREFRASFSHRKPRKFDQKKRVPIARPRRRGYKLKRGRGTDTRGVS